MLTPSTKSHQVVNLTFLAMSCCFLTLQKRYMMVFHCSVFSPDFEKIVCHMCKIINTASKNLSAISQTCILQHLMGLKHTHQIIFKKNLKLFLGLSFFLWLSNLLVPCETWFGKLHFLVLITGFVYNC